MMGDPSAAERAYQRLKTDILAGELPIGPIDIRGLGDRMRMSVTPVREALARLSAERLVRQAPHHGYEVANLSARRLHHLYDLAGALIDLCLERVEAPGVNRLDPFQNSPQPRPGDYAAAMAGLMGQIASSQPNIELGDHIHSLNDRLYPARRCEPRLFTGLEEEVAQLAALWASSSYECLRIALRKHSQSRVERIDALARLLAEQADDP